MSAPSNAASSPDDARVSAFDLAYRDAAAVTGKSEAELRAMALAVFASMLRQGMTAHRQLIWTATFIEPGKIEVEVGIPRSWEPKDGAK